jgi:hypothetical protein
MARPRILRISALIALAVTSLFWFWVATGLLVVHWPNNGNGVLAVVIVTAGVAILGYGLLSTVVSFASRSAQTIALPVLEGVSIASLLVICGFVSFFLLNSWRFLGGALLPIADIVLPVVGLVGSGAAAFLYDVIRRGSRKSGSRSRPVPPAEAGNHV